MKIKTCKMCGKPIPDDVKYIYYCSAECKCEGEKANKRRYYEENKYWLTYKKRLKRQLKNDIRGKFSVGIDSLALMMIMEAIEDIKKCSADEIRKYEDSSWRSGRRGGLPKKCKDYLSAKDFLLSDRIDMCYLTKLSGKDIYEILMKRKGIR